MAMEDNIGMKDLLGAILRIKSIANTGLLYAADEYDRERYAELAEISYNMLDMVTGHPTETLKQFLPIEKDYQTAKVDIRGLLLSADKKILMVKEAADKKW